jgi:hypothetical protein
MVWKLGFSVNWPAQRAKGACQYGLNFGGSRGIPAVASSSRDRDHFLPGQTRYLRPTCAACDGLLTTVPSTVDVLRVGDSRPNRSQRAAMRPTGRRYEGLGARHGSGPEMMCFGVVRVKCPASLVLVAVHLPSPASAGCREVLDGSACTQRTSGTEG